MKIPLNRMFINIGYINTRVFSGPQTLGVTEMGLHPFMLAYDYMAKAAWLKDSLPWFGQEFDETRALMGENYYSYGIKPNRKTLETLFRYSYHQDLCSRELTIEELFEPASLELTESLQAISK